MAVPCLGFSIPSVNNAVSLSSLVLVPFTSSSCVVLADVSGLVWSGDYERGLLASFPTPADGVCPPSRVGVLWSEPCRAAPGSVFALEQLAVLPPAWQAAAMVGRSSDFELWSFFAQVTHVTGCRGLWQVRRHVISARPHFFAVT